MINPSLLVANAKEQSDAQSSSKEIAQSKFHNNVKVVAVPDDLVERNQWVLWRREGGAKVPYRIDGGRASTTRRADWSEYELVRKALQSSPQEYSGLGFVFSEFDPFVGIDLDDCLEDTTGNPKPCVQAMVERFADTYMEVSPSGLGLKIWSKGNVPRALKILLRDGCGLEIYDRERYFTVTANVFRNAPLHIEDHADDILALFASLRDRETARYIPPSGKIRHGVQHTALVRLAGALVARGVCEEAIEACLQAVNRHQCERPGPPRNISQIVRSARKWRFM